MTVDEEKIKKTWDIWKSSREFSLDEGDGGRNRHAEAKLDLVSGSKTKRCKTKYLANWSIRLKSAQVVQLKSTKLG